MTDPPPDLPMPPQSSPARVDVAVVGAGPAGLAAAVRARWVKGHGVMPLRVAVFDPAPPGGLAAWKPNLLTGPGWKLGPRDLPGRLLSDLRDLAVPIVRDGVEQVDRRGRLFRLTTSAGARYTAGAVVLATGLRRLSDEREAFGSRLSVAFQGVDRFPALLQRAARAAAAAGGPLVLVGTRASADLLPWVEAAAAEAGVSTVWVLEDEAGGPRARAVSGPGAVAWPSGALLGRVVSSGTTGGAPLRVRAGDGSERSLDAGHVFIDYRAFELHPLACVRCDPEPGRAREGWLIVGRDASTTVPGLFGAGDCAGPEYAIVRALADGVTAGFAAWRHLFRERFGREGPLFAYRAEERPLTVDLAWVPDIPGHWLVDPLLPGPEFLRVVAPRNLPGPALLASGPTSAEWCRAAALDPQTLWERLFEARAATARPPNDEPCP